MPVGSNAFLKIESTVNQLHNAGECRQRWFHDVSNFKSRGYLGGNGNVVIECTLLFPCWKQGLALEARSGWHIKQQLTKSHPNVLQMGASNTRGPLTAIEVMKGMLPYPC